MNPRAAKIFMACMALMACLYLARAVHILVTLPSEAAIDARVSAQSEGLRSLLEPQHADYLKVHRTMVVGAESATRRASLRHGMSLLMSGLAIIAVLAFGLEQWRRAERLANTGDSRR